MHCTVCLRARPFILLPRSSVLCAHVISYEGCRFTVFNTALLSKIVDPFYETKNTQVFVRDVMAMQRYSGIHKIHSATLRQFYCTVVNTLLRCIDHNALTPVFYLYINLCYKVLMRFQITLDMGGGGGPRL